jgi:hypothetical protein
MFLSEGRTRHNIEINYSLRNMVLGRGGIHLLMRGSRGEPLSNFRIHKGQGIF